MSQFTHVHVSRRSLPNSAAQTSMVGCRWPETLPRSLVGQSQLSSSIHWPVDPLPCIWGPLWLCLSNAGLAAEVAADAHDHAVASAAEDCDCLADANALSSVSGYGFANSLRMPSSWPRACYKGSQRGNESTIFSTCGAAAYGDVMASVRLDAACQRLPVRSLSVVYTVTRV